MAARTAETVVLSCSRLPTRSAPDAVASCYRARPMEASEREKQLCAEFAPRIRLYGLKHLRDEDRARDLVQAVLVAVIDALRAGRIEDLDRIDRFVLGTARNLALRARDADRRAEPVDHATLAKLDIAVPETSDDALDVHALLRCMSEL